MTIRAHFDGHQVQVDEPITLPPDTELLVTVLPSESETDFEAERNEFARAALTNFAQIYEGEPDIYTEDMIIEPNPDYRDPWENRPR